MTKINVFAITVAIAMVTAVVVLTSVGQLTHTQCASILAYIIITSALITPLAVMNAKDAKNAKIQAAIKAEEEKHNAWVEEKLNDIKTYIPLFRRINPDDGFIKIRYACGRFDVVYQSNNYYNPYAIRTSFNDNGDIMENRVGFCNSRYGFENIDAKKLFEDTELIVAWRLGNQDAEDKLREIEEDKYINSL